MNGQAYSAGPARNAIGTVRATASLGRVGWFNNRSLPEPIGYVPPAQANRRAMLDEMSMAA